MTMTKPQHKPAHLTYPKSRRWQCLVLGRAGLDLYPAPDGSKINQAPSFSSDVGGSGGNIAVALARSGAKVSLISALSSDPVGQFVRQQLRAYGVDTHLLQTTQANERTSLALAEVRPDDCEVVIYRNDAADLQVQANSDISAALSQASNLVVTGTNLITPQSREQTLSIMREARQVGCNLWLDLDYRAWNWPDLETTRSAYQSAAALAHVLVGNPEEFAVLTSDFSQQVEICRAQQQILLLKQGAAGATLYAGEARLHTGIYKLQPAKPYGAGDAFLGNLVAHYTGQQDWQQAICAGSAAAALVVSQRGCASVMPNHKQIQDLQQQLSLSPAATWS